MITKFWAEVAPNAVEDGRVILEGDLFYCLDAATYFTDYL
jgi:hypothetical protein